jgi:hypothetical protein
MGNNQSVRPGAKPYVWCAGLLSLVWAALLVALTLTTDTEAAVTTKEMRYMAKALLLGAAALGALVALAFGGHWAFKAVTGSSPVEPAPSAALVDGQEADDRDDPTWSLEIRGIGITPGEYFQSEAWSKIKEKRSDFASIYSQDPLDYTDSEQWRRDSAAIRMGAAFKYAASDAVAYWPIPSFAVEPPNVGNRENIQAAGLISSGRNGGSLGVTLFLWQQAANTTHAQSMIEDVYTFFGDHPEPPVAVLATRDGEAMRSRYRARGTPGLADGYYVPSIIDTTAAITLARSDRVDRYLRPYAPTYRENNQDTRFDLSRLWFHYFEAERHFGKEYVARERARGAELARFPGTLPTAEWQATLPELWKHTNNAGPGNFTQTPWLPVRWPQHQIDEFDRMPQLGHLHRPIKVLLHDAEGKPLKPALQAQAMAAGWQQALATLPEGHTPVRVFHDSHDGTALGIALNAALHSLNTDGHGLELNSVDEGYDIGRRIGNVGITSPVVQIGLGAIASYHEGGVSAVVYAGGDGSATIQMVRPPSAEEKARNDAQHRTADPFMWRVSGLK